MPRLVHFLYRLFTRLKAAEGAGVCETEEKTNHCLNEENVVYSCAGPRLPREDGELPQVEGNG